MRTHHPYQVISESSTGFKPRAVAYPAAIGTEGRAPPRPHAPPQRHPSNGKTTLLAEWSERDPRPFAWVALDGLDDDDGIPFLRYIAAAIHRVETVAPEVFAALAGPGASIWSTGVPRVGSALATLERPMVLVLDDLHALENPSCLDVLAALGEPVAARTVLTETERNGCSSAAQTSAPSRTRQGSYASAWRRHPAWPAPGR